MRLKTHIRNNLVGVIRNSPLDYEDLREGIEALVAYHLYGDEEFCKCGDPTSFVLARAAEVMPIVDDLFFRAKAVPK